MTKDEQVLHKIQKYVDRIKNRYPLIAHVPLSDLEDNDSASHIVLSIMQLYELVQIIDDETVEYKLRILRSKGVKNFRNIAAHEYDNFNWRIGKNVCQDIIKDITPELIDECLTILQTQKQGIKIYTDDDEFQSSNSFQK